jgi:monoamine oxidase
MYDVAIAGGGLCGLAVAEALAGEGLAVVLIEARDRLGGRILTQTNAATGLAVDLGAGWFWPHAQPSFRDLVKRLDLHAFPQFDSGTVLSLGDPEQGPQPAGSDPVHGGALRISGGMGAVVAALAERLGGIEVRLGEPITEVTDGGDHVGIRLRGGAGTAEIRTRQLVCAMPPRIIAANVTFFPSLAPDIVSALQQTPTWMAASAKAVVCYQAGSWRASGFSGSAFVNSPQAVLAETFDAGDSDGLAAALGGFVALSPDLRQSFAAGLPMLIHNQVAQIFGPEYELGELHYQDWANEPLTCTPAERDDEPGPAPIAADPVLRQPQWRGMLHFGGSETAAREAGYMEGALDAAERIIAAVKLEILRAAVAVSPANRAGVDRFAEWVAEQREAGLALYEQRITQRLASQQRGQLTQRALLETVEAIFAAALAQLAAIPFATGDVPIEKGRSALTPLVQAPFRSLLSGLIDDAMRYNAASCALSNFPGEHRPSREYMQVILRDIGGAWVEFSKNANALLTGTTTTPAGGQ